AGVRDRLLQRAHQRRRLHQKVIDGVRKVRDKVDEELDRLLGELPEVQRIEVERREVREVLGRALERAQHLRRGDAAGERGREECASRQADVDVEVGRLPVDEEVVERLEAAELVRAARDGPTREDEGNARIL